MNRRREEGTKEKVERRKSRVIVKGTKVKERNKKKIHEQFAMICIIFPRLFCFATTVLVSLDIFGI